MPVQGPLDEETVSVICTRALQLSGVIAREHEGEAGPVIAFDFPDGGTLTLTIGNAFPDGTPQPYEFLHWLLVAGSRACAEILGAYDVAQLQQVQARLDWFYRQFCATLSGYLDLNGRLTERGREFRNRQALAGRAERAVKNEIRLDDFEDLGQPPEQA